MHSVFHSPHILRLQQQGYRSKHIYNCPCLRLASSAREGTAAGLLLHAAQREKGGGAKGVPLLLCAHASGP
jgi:hypothetical protein